MDAPLLLTARFLICAMLVRPSLSSSSSLPSHFLNLLMLTLSFTSYSRVHVSVSSELEPESGGSGSPDRDPPRAGWGGVLCLRLHGIFLGRYNGCFEASLRLQHVTEKRVCLYQGYLTQAIALQVRLLCAPA
eukprot:3751242-Rhodomonas_salina.1